MPDSMTSPDAGAGAIDEAVEEHRDARWRRDERHRVETVDDAERFVEDVGFAATFQDSRRPGPSLYVAV